MTSTMTKFQPSIKLVKRNVEGVDHKGLCILLSDLQPHTTLSLTKDEYSNNRHTKSVGLLGELVEIFLDLGPILGGEPNAEQAIWKCLQEQLGLLYLQTGKEEYKTVYTLAKLYFEPVIAHHGKQDYVIDEYRKLYTNLGSGLLSSSGKDDGSWIFEKYQLAQGVQEEELIIWRMMIE